jgi:hypothetical protein
VIVDAESLRKSVEFQDLPGYIDIEKSDQQKEKRG